MTTYSKRNNAFEKGEHEWRITDDALIERSPGGEDDIGPWAQVTAVRLAYAPTAQKTWRHLMELKFRNGAKWTIDNAHFKGIGDFENRSATYTPFVREVVEAIRQKSPNAKASIGAEPVGFWLNIAFLLVVFGLLATVIMLIPFDGLSGIVMIKSAIILISIPALFQWVIKARPRKATLANLPPDALP